MCDSVSYIQIDCTGKGGTFGAIDMIQQQHADVIIGPGCGQGKNIAALVQITFGLLNLLTLLYLYACQNDFQPLQNPNKTNFDHGYQSIKINQSTFM